MLVLEGQRKAAMSSVSASEKLDFKSNAVGKKKGYMRCLILQACNQVKVTRREKSIG